MNVFKKVTGNIFAKIILAFIILTFVLFGVSDFLLNSSGFWAAKVGGNTISGSAFNKALQSERSNLLKMRNDAEAINYTNSNQFRSDVLERLVNKEMIKKMRNEFGFVASKELILREIAKNQLFKGKEGKFDYELFKKFLAQNGLNDREYLDTLASEIATSSVAQTMSMTSPHNARIIVELEMFKQEKRVADVIKFSTKDLKETIHPDAKEVEEFFAANKAKYALAETRTASYLQFSKKDFAKDLEITDEDLRSEYERNKDQLLKPEKRNFYHIVFDKREDADAFLNKLDTAIAGDSSKQKAEFIKIAKDSYKKDLKAVSVNNIAKKDLISELAEATFSLAINERSKVLQSPLGFHIFLVNDIIASAPLSFEEAKADLKKSMTNGREEKVLQSKVDAINDQALTAASLKEIAEKNNLKSAIGQVKIDKNGKDSEGRQSAEIVALEEFSANVFSARKGQVSRVFSNKNFDNFYLVIVDEVTPSHERELSEVKAQVTQDLAEKKKQDALQNFAQNLAKQLRENPDNAAQIAAKHGLKIEKNREFSRLTQIDIGNGRKMNYRSKLSDEIFTISKIGNSTPAVSENGGEFAVALLREIRQPNLSDDQTSAALRESVDGFRAEVLQVFSSFMLEKYPVKVNEKLFQTEEK